MAYTYSFAVGDLDCTVISDGLSEADKERLSGIFNDVPADELNAAFNASYGEGGVAKRSMNVLLVESEGQTVLIDTGLGQASAPNGGGVFEGLEEIGVGLDEIDAVVISHCHGDHINGLTNPAGELNFPNASYYLSEVEWKHCMGPDGAARKDDDYGRSLLSKLGPIEDKVTLVKDGDTLFPGFQFCMSPGHTAGHLAIQLESEGERLLGLVDVIHFQLQLSDLSRSPRFDWDTSQSVATRERLVRMAAEESLLTVIYHFPFPGVGHFSKAESGYEWSLEVE
jgi:glyoxylase-like metal-dependent hydrolase (beta-lactamase superfamily II)